MSAMLCEFLPENYSSAVNRQSFFNARQNLSLDQLAQREQQPKSNMPRQSCNANLFFGFFFDGTRNNYVRDIREKAYSNIARLYDIFPGQSVPGVLPDGTEWKTDSQLFHNFFRVYIPGVASPFKQARDTGEGAEDTAGGAFGKKGNDRIVWALLQGINNVHRFFHNRPLLSSEEATEVATRLALNSGARKLMTGATTAYSTFGAFDLTAPRMQFELLLKRLHASVASHWPKNGKVPEKVNPSIVQTIYISTFGFSRGATQARAFANWLDSLCRLDAQLCGNTGHSLGGFPVQFDFLGLFDTVASVGVGNTLASKRLFKLIDGHQGWADSEDSLRVSGCFNQCVHLVAGHELRRSFPLDSIAVGATYPRQSSEIVFPGVHSDVGGGYAPKQQGKGVDANGDDMLSRLTLLYMYKAARLAGVPLKLELAAPTVQQKFAVKAQLIKDFNSYIEKCVNRVGSLTDIVREQQILQMGWRYWRRDQGPSPIYRTPSFVRASNYDKNDLDSSNKEFNAELAEFEKSLAKWKGVAPHKQDPGFDNSVPKEWEEIARYWPFKHPDPSIAHFFDEYVHDSRAGFKPLGDEGLVETVKSLELWSGQLKVREALYKSPWVLPRGPHVPGPPDYGMNTNKRMAAEAFDQAKQAAPQEKDLTKLIPRFINEGREPASLTDAGYLRFRNIYGGSDTVLLSQWMPTENVGQDSYMSSGKNDQLPTQAA